MIAATRVRPTAESQTPELGHSSRMASRLLTVGMVLAAVAFVAITLGTSLIGRTAFYGGGVLLNNAPWIADVNQPVAIDNNLVGDTIDVVLPSRAEIVERARDGDLAGWTSRQGPGTELGSVPSYGLLAPTAVAWWVLPTDLAPGWERLTILIVAAAGTALFLRRVGLGGHAAWTAGMVYAASGFMISWTNWPQAAVAGTMPWLLWAVERSLQRRTLGSVVPVALVVAALLLGGFPALTGWAIYLAGGYALLRLIAEAGREGADAGRWRTAAAQIGRLTLGLVLGVGLAAAQLAVFVMQFLELDTSYRAGGFAATQPLRMGLTTLFPHTWGTTVNVFFTRTNPIEANAYLGAAAAVLCVLAVVSRPHPSVLRGVRSYFVAAAALCAVLVYVQGPLVAWMGQLPVFSGNPIGRLVALMLLALSVLAGFGADAILRPRPEGSVRRVLAVLAVVATGLVVLLLARFVRNEVNGQRSVDPALAAATTTTPFLIAAVALAGVVVALVLLRHWRPRAAVAAFVVVPIAVSVQGVVAAAPVWEQVDADRFYPATDMHEFLLENIGHDRLATTGLTMLNGTPAYYGLRSATGHVFFPEPYSDLINRISPEGRLTPTYWTLPGGVDVDLWQSPGLDRLAVRFLPADSESALPGNEVPVVTGQSSGALGEDPVEVTLPAGPLRGVYLQLAEGPAEPSSGYLVADLTDSSGATVATTRRLVRFPRPAGALPVPLAAEDLDGAATLRLSWDGPGSPSFATDAAGIPALSVITPEDDGLRLADDDNGAVWERTTALPRIRWASSSRVVEDADRRADVLAGIDLPPDTVVLSEPGRDTDEQAATVEVQEDSGDTVAVAVDAEGAGYLVLADAIQSDWSVEVDGRAATIEDADHAFGAVHLPAGRHDVVFTYTPRGQQLGAAVSIGSLVVLLTLALAPAIRRRRRVGTAH